MIRRIATNAGALAFGGVVAQIAFVSIEVVIARHLGQADYGVFSSVYAIALTSLFVIDLGMSWRLIESGSRDSSSIAELLGTTVTLKAIGFVLLYPIVVLALLAFGYDSRTVVFFGIFFGYALGMAVQDSLAAVYTARQRMVVNAIFQGGTPIVVAAFVTVALAMGGGLNGVGIAFVAGGLLVAGVWATLTWRREHPRARMAATGGILRGSYLYGLSGLLSQILYKSDILLLSALATMPQVGIYAAAYKLLDLANKVPILGARVMAPALFQQSPSDAARYRSAADGFVRVSAAAGILLAIAVFPSADWVIGLLFGDRYGEAASVLRVLSASIALKFVVVSLQTVLTTRDQHRVRTSALALATAVTVLAHWMLIPRFGVMGAATAVVAGEAFLSILYLSGIADSRLRGLLSKRLGAAILAASAGLVVPARIGVVGPAASTVGAVTAIAALFAIRYVRPAEVGSLFRGITARPAEPVRETVHSFNPSNAGRD